MIIDARTSKENQQLLKIVSTPVESAQEAVEIIEQVKQHLVKTSNSVGLAAIQIGIPKKIGVLKTGDTSDEFLYLINPEIVKKEGEFIFFREGCLSFPNEFYNTKRYQHVTIKNYRIENDKLEEERLYFYYPTDPNEDKFAPNKILTIAIQHEFDHFDGKIITEYAVKSQPIVVSGKVGRNDPCPCGSNKKFKKCCGA